LELIGRPAAVYASEQLTVIQQKARSLRTAAEAVLDRFVRDHQDARVETVLADVPVSIRSLDLGSSHDTGDFVEVTVGYPDGPWQFTMHDVGGDLHVVASGEQVGYFPYTLSLSVYSPGTIDRVLDRLAGTIELLDRC
jgi:hypothetical protein